MTMAGVQRCRGHCCAERHTVCYAERELVGYDAGALNVRALTPC